MKPFDVRTARLDGTQLIEASAGTGKTWTLCALVLRLLLEQSLPIQQVLVVTFTNAATAELRDRIRARIAETLAVLHGRAPVAGDAFVADLLERQRALGRDDAAMATLLEQALQGFDEAAVFTIHGFCQRALADTPFAAGVPLTLEIITDDREGRLQVVRDFWRRHVAGSAASPELAAALRQGRDAPETWALALNAHLARPLAESVWPDDIDADAGSDLAALRAAHVAAQAIWERERDDAVATLMQGLARLHGGTYKAETVQAAAADWDRLLAAADPLAVTSKLEKLDLLRSGRLAERAKKNQNPPAHRFFDAAEALAALRDQALQALARQRLRLLRQMLASAPDELRRAQRERHAVSFDNMLINLHQRLHGPHGEALAAALRDRYRAALIDEFQDTDPLQFGIFQRLFGDAGLPLCLIGDPKQAIYAFRGADLHTYLQARRHVAAEHTLVHNQRSVKPLIDAFNALFGAHPRAFMLPGLDHHPVRFGAKPRAPLEDRTEGAAPSGPLPAALRLWQLPDDPPRPKRDALAAAARACADEIARLLANARRGDITLGGRPLEGGDIAVLVRSRAHGSLMRAELSALGVASVELATDSVFRSVDAEALAQLLTAMLDPGHLGRLRSALATDPMGWDAVALQALDADDPRLAGLVERFAGYRELWRAHGLGPMWRQCMVAEGMHARLLARPDGERRLTNLRHLAELLQQAEHAHASPEALCRWLIAQRSDGRSDEATQLRLESDRHLVQVVTIHRSKGLEYPIVFCPFLWDGHPGPPATPLEGRPWHRDDGRAVLDHRPEVDDLTKSRIQLERAAETLRLIYVALTRAVHRCQVVIGSYASGGYASTTEAGRSLLNWLVAGGGDEPHDWLARIKLTPAQVGAAWRGWAAANAPQVALAPLPAAAMSALAPDRPPAARIAALPAPAMHPGWWIGSFSALAGGARHERAAVDHDLRVAPTADAPADETPVAAAAEEDVLRFPRGPAAGEVLHAVFERADFAAADGWPAAIESALRRQPLPASEGDPAIWPPMLLRMLHDVLNTPLAPGLQLARVAPAQRLTEWEFMLPAAPLTTAALAGLLRDEGWPAPPLPQATLNGYLRGFVDLVFEHQGRWHIVDWKSNHLGDRPHDYAAAALDGAMLRHGYALQALLYTLALHRHLRQRLPGYDPETHLGGVFYLFVRGVRPGWRQPDGSACGVARLQPPPRLLQRLDELFEGGDVTRRRAGRRAAPEPARVLSGERPTDAADEGPT